MVRGSRAGSRGLARPLGLLTLLALIALGALSWREGSFSALWLTPDQAGQRAYDRLEFSEAADRFADPMRRGVAAYDAGRYGDAAASFGRLPSAAALYNRGNAQMKGREYAAAIASYRQAVVEAPDWTEARENLALARYVLAYIEEAREQSDTEKMGADEYVFDKRRKGGIDEVITDQSVLEEASAEKWMRSVNTETGEFLRLRFALEADREAP